MDSDLTKLTTNELINLYARIPDALKEQRPAAMGQERSMALEI